MNYQEKILFEDKLTSKAELYKNIKLLLINGLDGLDR